MPLSGSRGSQSPDSGPRLCRQFLFYPLSLSGEVIRLCEGNAESDPQLAPAQREVTAVADFTGTAGELWLKSTD